jgi:hypothetical protein
MKWFNEKASAFLKPKYIWSDLDMIRSLVIGIIIGTVLGLIMAFELWKPVVVNCWRPLVG